ncbi:MAG: hypothetical protein IIX85_05955, partial [Clostridia bacterium]|nr:hypothetical protein [Clostridia bacterium]
PETEPFFYRVPLDVAEATSEGVNLLSRESAGGRVRFSTNSPYIVIKAVMPTVSPMQHMPLTGTSGFDLYVDSSDGTQSLFHHTFVPPPCSRLRDMRTSTCLCSSPNLSSRRRRITWRALPPRLRW